MSERAGPPPRGQRVVDIVKESIGLTAGAVTLMGCNGGGAAGNVGASVHRRPGSWRRLGGARRVGPAVSLLKEMVDLPNVPRHRPGLFEVQLSIRRRHRGPPRSHPALKFVDGSRVGVDQVHMAIAATAAAAATAHAAPIPTPPDTTSAYSTTAAATAASASAAAAPAA